MPDKTLDSEFIVREASDAVISKDSPPHGKWFACLRREDGSGSDHYLHRDGQVRVGAWHGDQPTGFHTARAVVEATYVNWVRKGKPVQLAELLRSGNQPSE